MIEKVISGGQTGADQGGLFAASALYIETGGWAPVGFRTETGLTPMLGTRFGLKEYPSSKYADRTFANVKDSDGTIRFATDFTSPGERCTFKAIQEYRKPYLDIYVPKPPPHEDVVKWLKDNNIKVLNVAGNRESTSPGLQEFVAKYLTKVFGFKGLLVAEDECNSCGAMLTSTEMEDPDMHESDCPHAKPGVED